jgi:hypothetical protein
MAKDTEKAPDLKTEGEKAAPDPVNQSVDPVPVTTMEDLGIGPRDPYPTGGTPPERDVYGNVIEKDEPDARTRTKP